MPLDTAYPKLGSTPWVIEPGQKAPYGCARAVRVDVDRLWCAQPPASRPALTMRRTTATTR